MVQGNLAAIYLQEKEYWNVMKKIVYGVFILALLVGAFLTGYLSGSGKSPEKNRAERQVLYYVDPMNPSHTSDRPGTAPCGMKMEPVYADAAPAGARAGKVPSSLPTGTVSISPEKQQLIGVRLGRAEKTPWTYTLRTLGKVAVDETRYFRLVSATDGWTKKIYPHSTGSLVKKGEPLISFYSRDFLTAQQSYFYALRTMDRLKGTPQENNEQLSLTGDQIRAAEEALLSLGMDEIQIREIARTRQAARDIILRAPITGFVLERNVFLGQRFERGTELFRIVDSARVWILANIYENEARYVRPGAAGIVTLPYDKKNFRAKVSDTLPFFDAASRTLKVRLELDNHGYSLRPDMYVDVQFPITLPAAVTVPAESVLDSGLKKTIFVCHGNGFFEPRQVETGSSLGGRVEITKGLMAGEQIVLSGNFLIDSESRMKMAANTMQVLSKTTRDEQKPKDPVCNMELNEKTARSMGLTVDYKGLTYYFCTEQCRQQFKKNPENYVEKPVPDQKPSSYTHSM
jgi:membrane fusion protein, copper/silver efflux system